MAGRLTYLQLGLERLLLALELLTLAPQQRREALGIRRPCSPSQPRITAVAPRTLCA